MPTVLRIDGWRVVIYPNDHSPAHVHVIGPGWVVVVNLVGPEVREAIGCSRTHTRHVLSVVEEHRHTLLEVWRQYHG